MSLGVSGERSLGLVVQARLGSTRLPRKTLLPLGGGTLLDMVLARLSLVPAEVHILATDEASGAELAPLAARHGFELLVGPGEDVLARFCLAIRTFGLGRVVRATGDNPLVSHEAALALLAEPGILDADYASYDGLPLGMGVELVKAAALIRAADLATDPFEREHVCPHLYRNPGGFSIDRRPAPAEFRFPEARVTVDLASDYEAVLRIYGALHDGKPIATSLVLAYLRGLPAAGERKQP